MYKRYWLVKRSENGFEMQMMVYGTENELWAYMESEFGHTLRYSGATDEEVAAAKVLKMKCYLAPDIR